MLRSVLLGSTISLLILVDRVIKSLFLKGFAFYCCKIDFSLIRNTGIAFGLFKNKTLFIAIFNALFIIIISLFLFWDRFKKDVFVSIAFVLILSGAISNFIDRLFLGYVVDYINVGWFPVFNLADVMISLGAFIWIIDEFVINR